MRPQNSNHCTVSRDGWGYSSGSADCEWSLCRPQLGGEQTYRGHSQPVEIDNPKLAMRRLRKSCYFGRTDW